MHTAVKIAPRYEGPAIYVKDASRAVGVAQNLVSDTQREPYCRRIAEEYEAVRDRHRSRQRRDKLLALAAARANAPPIEWSNYQPPVPQQPGIHVLEDVPLAALRPFIDWTPFFKTWELAGSYPKILQDAVVGEQARSLFADAQHMLDRLIEERWLTARATYGFWPANAQGDDIVLYRDEGRDAEQATLHHLRQQKQKPAGRPNHCLSDFIAPRASGLADYLGAFVVTAGIGLDTWVARFEADHDDYQSIMVKALADRLAEALAEWLHRQVRRQAWGYATDEQLDNEALIAESYRGIRPAPGYPACPEHTEKAALWALLDAEQRIGVSLTDSYAMLPAASVSGWYFSHPQARYFGVGVIGRDQVADYARRKGMTLAEAERWLAPQLAYEPD